MFPVLELKANFKEGGEREEESYGYNPNECIQTNLSFTPFSRHVLLFKHINIIADVEK